MSIALDWGSDSLPIEIASDPDWDPDRRPKGLFHAEIQAPAHGPVFSVGLLYRSHTRFYDIPAGLGRYVVADPSPKSSHRENVTNRAEPGR